jgi:CheY-like chemotaxis protein
MNLFGNAMKYTKVGYVHVKLEAADVAPTHASNVCTHVTLSVTDTGQGISREYMRTKLFTPFAQESSLTPGTGLGLSLVKSIVDMLNGEIDIESSVGVGTKVTVRLPMSKGTSLAGYASAPASAGSVIERMKDDSIELVKTHAKTRTIAVYKSEEQGTTSEQEASSLMYDCITAYLKDWYGFTALVWSVSAPPDIIIVDESELQSLVRAMPELMHSNCHRIGLVLCQTASHGKAKDLLTNEQNFEEIRYPFGPYKLARALRLCFEKCAPNMNVPTVHTLPKDETVAENASQPHTESVTAAADNTTLTSTDAGGHDTFVLLAAHKNSDNGQMAIDNTSLPQMTNESVRSETHTEFPFPSNGHPGVGDAVSPIIKPESPSHDHKHRPTMQFRRTISATRQEMNLHDSPETNAMSLRGAQTNKPEPHQPVSTSLRRSPRMLLVDDNKINLKLLQTFMRKRKYTDVTNAEDGLEAVNGYTSLLNKVPPEPPDIILMDISMPVMNGFEATRRIRDIERESHKQLPPMQTPPTCLIIALTGLASGRDQSEAFTSGFDLYITKPVSFAEISRLLDNWEANGGGATSEGVPNGAVTVREWQGPPTESKPDCVSVSESTTHV